MKKIGCAALAIAIIGGGVVAITELSTQARSKPLAHQATHKPIAAKPTSSSRSDGFSPMSTPRTLLIPSLGITSSIRPVGTTPDGAMDIPDSLTDAGWYKESANPGNSGKSVLAVHTGYPNKPSVFRQLEHVQPGTKIQVRDVAGATATFEVIETARYPADTAPLGIIFGISPTARLNIVTCTGAWDAAHNSYKERLVIFSARTE